ncbi:MAG TPA: RNA polymerase sigma factor [Xanthobacteraceae bacterium]|nr:RNA polymerase sigma factor [Xanthobacteraceae bacterium]
MASDTPLTDSRVTDIHGAIDAVWRIEQAKLIAGLARMVRDVALAEELAQDALVAALEQWPASGIPDKPGAWLMTTAKRRAIDRLRRHKLAERKHEEIGRDLDSEQESALEHIDDALDDDIGDDLLRLMFTACHPVLSTEARVALTLRLIGGLTTDEIARAFLAPEPTIAQRLVRAKRTLTEQRIAFEVPRGADRDERLSSVLEVLYLVFNEGYTATAGDDWMRPQLCQDAMRLGRILAGLAPSEPEVHGLVALMEIQASRFAARTDPSGEPVLLLEQNRARWDQLLIRRGLAALEQAETQARAQNRPQGTYALQAAIAACHARARTAAETDWLRIVGLYGALAELAPSPIVDLNRAVALSFAFGPEAGLTLVDAIGKEPALKNYHLLPGVRGDLLVKLGRHQEARAEFERAASLTRNERERALLLKRAAECEKNAVAEP